MLRQKDRPQVYKVAVNAALGSFLFGYQLVNISSLQLLFMNKNHLTRQQTRAMLSIITAALPLMAIFGMLFVMVIGSAMLKILVRNYKGRYLMIYMDVLGILGILVQNVGLSLWPVLIGRLVLGFVVGINSGLVAQYTFSVTPTTLSGSVGALRQVFLNVGVALGYTLGFLIDADNVEDNVNWRILLSFPLITCLVRAILLLTVLPYQIPLHRTKSNKIKRMQKYYYKIYQTYATGNQTSTNPTQLQQNTQKHQIPLPEPFPEPSQSPTTPASETYNLIICIILAASNQFCGINAIIFYAKQLFMRITENNNNLSQLTIILLGVVQIVATFVGGRLMDRWSKRKFLVVGEICMVGILAGIFLFNLYGYTSLVVLFIFMHTIAYSFSIGQLLLFYAAKMLDSTGIVVMVNWFATFLVAISAEFMMKILGIGNMCLVFCILLSACLVFLLRNLPSDKEILERQMSSLTRPLDNKPKQFQLQQIKDDQQSKNKQHTQMQRQTYSEQKVQSPQKMQKQNIEQI